MSATTDQVKATLGVIIAVADAIKDLKRVPSGKLYAVVMNRLSFEQYESVISILKRSEIITETNHELVWMGGK